MYRSLPFHCLPQKDELLSSWMVRLSMGNACKLHTFWTYCTNEHIWTRDIDRTATDELFTTLSQLSPEFETVDFEKHSLRLFNYQQDGGISKKGTCSLILPVGIYHRLRTKHGLQFCPHCLSEDDIPYFQVKWRHVYQFCCSKHSCLLQNQCPNCGEPVNFHRISLDEFETLSTCYSCGFDLRDSLPSSANQLIVNTQCKFDSLLSNEWVKVQNKVIHIVPFLRGINQLMKQSLAYTSSERLVDAFPEFEELLNTLSIQLPIDFGSIEQVISVNERVIACCLVGKLLDSWPATFIDMFERLGWKSRQFRHRYILPFWLGEITQGPLNKALYNRNAEEIHNAGRVFIKHHPNGTALDFAKFIGSKPYALERRGLVDIADVLSKARANMVYK